VNVKTIWFNGIPYPITWTSVTSWRAAVPLQNGNNLFTVVGVDIHGQPISGDTGNVSVNYSGTIPSAAGNVVINEIMYNPLQPDAAYVELYNRSTNLAFDLSGFQLNGLSYIFPSGSLLAPTNYLTLASDGPSFAAAYGATIPVFDKFPGSLQNDGETLTLIKPGTNAASDVVISKVRYEGGLPWPTNANGGGTSLQLIDALQDNWRAGNWAVQTTNNPPQPKWVYVTATGTASSSGRKDQRYAKK